MGTLETLLVSLVLSMNMSWIPPHSQTAQTNISADAARYTCEVARREAASGIFHGTKTGSQKTGLYDSCVAAVYDASKAGNLEANPIRNPKNYTCVGKNVRLTFTSDESGLLTESWSASKNVPAGTCATQFCDEGGCRPAKRMSGLPGLGEPSRSGAAADSYSDSQISADFAASPSAQSIDLRILDRTNNLGVQIDDAFTQLDADRFERDSSGLPDVSKTKNPDLFTGMRDVSNEIALREYERSVTSPEVQNSFEYQNLAFATQGIDLTSAIPTSLQVPIDTFNEVSPKSSDIVAQSLIASESTFDNNETFWSDWRRSDNVEDERPKRPTWTELVQSRAGKVYGTIQEWVVGAGAATKNLFQKLF